MKALQHSVVSLLAFGILAPLAYSQAVTAPLDAMGSIQTSVAPYVSAATRMGTVLMDGVPIKCTVAVPTTSTEVRELRSGSSRTIQKFPGYNRVSELTVSGDYDTMRPFLDWYDTIVLGSSSSVFWKDLRVGIFYPSGQFQVQFVTFRLFHCWPRQVTYSPTEGDRTVTVQIAVDSMIRAVGN